MSDQRSTPIDNVDVARGTDMDLRDDVADRPEIDLGGGNLRSAVTPRHCNGEVRLQVIAEVDRPEVGTPDSRPHEARILGQVALTAALVRGKTGHPQLHFARRIE